MFGTDLFGEPAWDLLLELDICRSQKLPLSMMSACIAASVPPSAGFRSLLRLEQHGLVERVRVGEDESAALIEITDDGYMRMTSLLLEMA